MRWKARMMKTWENIRSSYWFTPSLMCLGAIHLSLLTLWIDRNYQAENFVSGIFYTGSAEGARSLLSTIASSLISVAGVTFSITIVALTLASNQFGPRLLRNFMRDLGNQIVLGTYLSAFLFCLLVLRQVHDDGRSNAERFVPQISIFFAVLLSLVGVGVLIYFIHHIAASIQAPQVIALVAKELHDAIEKFYPAKIGETHNGDRIEREELKQQIPESFDREAAEILIEESGYLERIEPEQLLEEAVARDLLIRIERRPGQFLVAGEVVLRVWPSARVDDDLRRNLGETFAMGSQRTLGQDAEFAVDQLVEIALLALSPGVNDAFTAIMVVDRLGETLAFLARREIPSPYRTDETGRLRVIAHPRGFRKMFDAAFTQIRQNSTENLAVTLRLFRVCRRIAAHSRDSAIRMHLRQFVDDVYNQLANAIQHDSDRNALEAQYQTSLESLAREA